MNLRLFVLVVAFGVALLTLSADAVTSPWAAALVLLPAIAGVWMFRAGWRFVNEADELTRRIQLEGMAAGFGVGVVASMLERPLQEASVLLGKPWWIDTLGSLEPFFWMVLVYSATVVRLQRRYCA